MLQFLSFSRWRTDIMIKKQLSDTTPHEAVCISCYDNGDIKKAWHMVSETILAGDGCEISDEMMKVLLLIFKNYESLFSDAECLSQLKRIMKDLHKYTEYGDILALGTLLYWETKNTAFSRAQVDSETLMKKATQCLKIWTYWFFSVGNEILEQESDVRVLLSLRFLKMVAEIAIVNFQNFTAVTSLSYVSHLAHFGKHKGLVRAATHAILAIIPQMGLQNLSKIDYLYPDPLYVYGNLLGFGEDTDPLYLTDIATHHLKTGQLSKFLIVRDAFYRLFWWPNKISKISAVVFFVRAVIKRLEAEFLMIPLSQSLVNKAVYRHPMRTALSLAKTSLEHINSTYSWMFGENFPRQTSTRDTLGPWKIVHEYLCIQKLMGEILQYTGLIHTAIEHLLLGQKVADKFKLVTWGAIFSGRLAELQLISGNLDLAKSALQRAKWFLKYKTIEAGLDHCHRQPTIDFVNDDNLACGLKMTDGEMEHPSLSCQHSDNLEENMFSNLLEHTDNSVDHQHSNLLLTDITACCSCCQTEIVGVCIRLMCLQAEILWKKEKSICQVSHLLQHSLNMAHQFAGFTLCTDIINFMAVSGWKVCPTYQDIGSNKRTLVETALKCAEIYFQNLYIRNTEVQIACDHVLLGTESILRLLDIVETVGEKATGFPLCNALIASALLIRNHCNYLTVLRTSPDEDFPEAESDPYIPCFAKIFHVVNLAVDFVKKDKTIRDNKRSLLLLSLEPHESVETDENEDLLDRSGHSDFDSPVSELDHHTVEPSLLEQLTAYFPSLTVYQNNKNTSKRISCLQRALEQFQGLPHSQLYRQISQSLALCLWEKQMADMCGGSSQASSSQIQIAAYLTDSMHVTFQHQMAEKFISKLRLAETLENQTKQEAKINKQAMQEALDVLKFGRDVMQNFRNRLATLPADWTVIQMTTVNFDPTNPGTAGQIFITRLISGQEPFTVGLPNNRRQFLRDALRFFEDCSFHCHYRCLSWKAERMLATLKYMQEVSLGGYKWFLRGRLDCAIRIYVQKVLDDAGRRAAHILQQQGIYICHTELRNLMETLLAATEADILSVVECMWPLHVTGTITQIFMDAQKEVTRLGGDVQSERRGPVIFILDNELANFPWENMPDLTSDNATRMPSFVSLIALLRWHTKMVKSQFKSGVERKRIIANICGSSNCAWKECIQLKEKLEWYKHWLVDYPDSSVTELHNSSLYICSAHRSSNNSFVRATSGKTLVIQLSSKSGLLESKNGLDGYAVILNYLLEGCPAVVGKLTVSYSECAALISRFFPCWMAQTDSISIRKLLVMASQATGNFGICGTPLVIYGLPVMMN